MIRCDALIAGGGPAGLAAAIALRQKGLDVLVADALRPPIDKACGEGLMPDAQKDLAALGIQLTAHDGAAFDGIAFLSGRHHVAAPFEHGTGIGIRRLQLHSLLVERCRELGVRLAWGSRVCVAEKQPLAPGWRTLHLPLRDRRGWPILPGPPVDRPGPGKDPQPPIRHPLSLSREALEPHGGSALGRSGPSLHHTRRPGGNLRGHRRPLTSHSAWRRSLPACRLLRAHLEGAHELSKVRGALTTTRKLRRVTAGNVALTGDASGSADAITGEGIALVLPPGSAAGRSHRGR